MSEKVHTLHPVPGRGFDTKDLKTLDGRYRCLCRFKGALITLVLCSSRLAPSREYIEIGLYTMTVWMPIADIEVVEILEKLKIEDDHPRPRPWWRRLFSRPSNG